MLKQASRRPGKALQHFSTGEEDLPAEMYKHAAEVTVSWLDHIFGRLWGTNRLEISDPAAIFQKR